MARKDEYVGRPNQPAPPTLKDERQISDTASRPFTSTAKGNAMIQSAPHDAGHSFNPQDPYQYAKDRGKGSISPRSKTNA